MAVTFNCQSSRLAVVRNESLFLIDCATYETVAKYKTVCPIYSNALHVRFWFEALKSLKSFVASSTKGILDIS